MCAATATSSSPWLTLPPTPILPQSQHDGHANVDNISLWYGLYGQSLNSPAITSPVVLLHGGKISSRWYGHLTEHLARTRAVIALDTRGHGRSSDDLSVPLTYTQFAEDTIALLDLLKVPRAQVVGWSDGANTGLQLAMQHPTRIQSLIAFGANYNPDQANTTGIQNMPFLADLVSREHSEYLALNPNPDWDTFSERMGEMQSRLPMWNQQEFSRIPTFLAPKILCADGDHEEIVSTSTTPEIHNMVRDIPCSSLQKLPEGDWQLWNCVLTVVFMQIRHSKLTMLSNVSHFA